MPIVNVSVWHLKFCSFVVAGHGVYYYSFGRYEAFRMMRTSHMFIHGDTVSALMFEGLYFHEFRGIGANP